MNAIKPLAISAVFAFAVAATPVGTSAQSGQSGATPVPPMPQTTDMTVTGCLLQGSAPTVFLLDNARIDPKDSKESPKKYLIVSQVEDVQLKDLVNHEVTATGAVKARADVQPVTPPPSEKDLPVLTARSLASVSDRCMANAGR